MTTLFSSRDQAISESAEQAIRRLEVADGFDALRADHTLAWNRIWNVHHLRITNDEHSQSVLNLRVFHLVQTVSMHSIDLDVGVPARGLGCGAPTDEAVQISCRPGCGCLSAGCFSSRSRR